ncbi:MAG: tetratricopeptide repeat protein [Dehalococcoidia bacterium]|nr:tetratricopeptide repeat protein [Dehalococcoidia bacterium]
MQIGISGGTVLAGSYGGSTRRTYGTLGDEVNMAARLMQAAPIGQILVSEAVQKAAADDYIWEALPPMLVKGKAEPATVHRLIKGRQGNTILRQELRFALPMVGRLRELELVKQKLEKALRGQGQIIGVTAEAGMGKSRLVAEIINQAQSHRLTCFGGECESYGANSAYLVWRPIWQSIFGVDPASSVDEQFRHIEGRLAMIDPGLISRLPLLSVLLGMHIPDNELTRSFDAKLRKTSLESLLFDVLRRQVGLQPTLLVLEDCHWLDPLSVDLVEVVGRAISELPVVVVLAYRPFTGIAGRTPLSGISQMPCFTEINLAELSAEEAELLVASKLQRTLGAGAQGNPFYIEELLNFLSDRKFDPRDPGVLEKLDLPASLHSLILTRIDQVTESQKMTLKIASIIGRLFRFHWLWGVYPRLGRPGTVMSDLDGLSDIDITSLAQPEPDLTYLFKHIVTQEVAYESQPHATRTVLHGQLGQYIETTCQETLEQFVDLLAFHFDRSSIQEKRRQYLRLAGEAAQAAYANSSAIDYFQRVLPLLSGRELMEVHFRLGQVLELVGQWDEADRQYQQSLSQAEALIDLAAQAMARRSIGWLLRKRGHYVEAHERMQEARTGFDRSGDPAGVSQVMSDIGEICRMQGLYAEARSCYEESLMLADSVVDPRERLAAKAQALKGSGTVASLQGDYNAAGSLFAEGLAMQRELENKPGIGILLNNLGIVARHQRELEKARKMNDECLNLFREIGDKWVLGYLLNNQGCVLSDLGDYAGAMGLLHESLEVGRQLGDRVRIARSLNSLADLAMDHGAYGEARAWLEESLTLSL